MGISTLLVSINQYAHDYTVYLIRFFQFARQTGPAEHIEDKDGLIVVHAIISLTAGAYLEQVIVTNKLPETDQVAFLFVHQVGLWTFVTIALQFMVVGLWKIGRGGVYKPQFKDCLSLVLRVFPPAYFVSAAATLFFASAAYAVHRPSAPAICSKLDTVLGELGVTWLLVGLGIFAGLSQAGATQIESLIPKIHRNSRRAVSVATVLLLMLLHLVWMKPAPFFAALDLCYNTKIHPQQCVFEGGETTCEVQPEVGFL